MPNTNSIQGAREALNLAKKPFLKGFVFDVKPTTAHGTGVNFDEETNTSTLFINYETSSLELLLPVVGCWRDAWLLILAHESGHLALNSICLKNGENPADPAAQLRAIGLDKEVSIESLADFQKETAIEAFCDVVLAREAKNILSEKWKVAVGVFRDMREQRSKKIGFFKGDEYATQPALSAFIEQDGCLTPEEAAKVALDHSIRQTSGLKKKAVAAAVGISELRELLGDGVRKWKRDRKEAKSRQHSQRPK